MRELAHLWLVVLVVGVFGASAARAETEPAPPAQLDADELGKPAEPEEEEEGPNRGNVSLTVGMDFTTAYFFRGILNERDGFIWQPYADIGLTVFEGDGAIQSVALGVGIWNSFQSEKTLASGSGPSNLYETDIYPTLTVGFADNFEFAFNYFFYTSPNGAFDTVQEVDLWLTYDDSPLWSFAEFSLNPSAEFVIETQGTSFGDEEGIFLGLNLEPSIVLLSDYEYPLTVAVPLELGLSLSDYYEAEGEGDETFGFFSFGLGLSVPLAFIPEDLGEWSAGLGIEVLVLGENLKAANQGDSPWPIGTLGIEMEY